MYSEIDENHENHDSFTKKSIFVMGQFIQNMLFHNSWLTIYILRWGRTPDVAVTNNCKL